MAQATQASSTRWKPAVYFLLGQAGWFACVLGAARGVSYLGVLFTLLLIAAHLKLANDAKAEIKLIGMTMLIGAIWESTLIAAGLLAYPGSANGAIAPLWILLLWGLFAAQFNTTYRWLKNRLLAAALLGAIAGPLSFRAGAALGAVRFVSPTQATVALAMGWAVILPLVVLLSRRWDGAQ